MGISQLKKGHKWQVSVGHNGKINYVGSFNTKEEAIDAKIKFKIEHNICMKVLDLDGEKWAISPSIGDGYRVSNKGRVKSLNYKNTGDERLIKPYISPSDNYLRISIIKGVILVHRLVAEAFLGESKLCVNHIDSNKHNNCIENLEYTTQRGNVCYDIIKKRGFIGAQYDKSANKWGVNIIINGVIIHKGFFDSQVEAQEVYLNALLEYGLELDYRYITAILNH